MRNQSVSIFKILIILLVCAVSSGAVPGTQEKRGFEDERPGQNPRGEPPSPHVPPPGLTLIAVPAFVTEPPAQYISFPEPARGQALRSTPDTINTGPTPWDRGFSPVGASDQPIDFEMPEPLAPASSPSFLAFNFDDNIPLNNNFIFIP